MPKDINPKIKEQVDAVLGGGDAPAAAAPPPAAAPRAAPARAPAAAAAKPPAGRGGGAPKPAGKAPPPPPPPPPPAPGAHSWILDAAPALSSLPVLLRSGVLILMPASSKLWQDCHPRLTPSCPHLSYILPSLPPILPPPPPPRRRPGGV